MRTAGSPFRFLLPLLLRGLLLLRNDPSPPFAVAFRPACEFGKPAGGGSDRRRFRRRARGGSRRRSTAGWKRRSGVVCREVRANDASSPSSRAVFSMPFDSLSIDRRARANFSRRRRCGQRRHARGDRRAHTASRSSRRDRSRRRGATPHHDPRASRRTISARSTRVIGARVQSVRGTRKFVRIDLRRRRADRDSGSPCTAIDSIAAPRSRCRGGAPGGGAPGADAAIRRRVDRETETPDLTGRTGVRYLCVAFRRGPRGAPFQRNGLSH